MQPTNIFLDAVKSGVASILVRWNIQQVERTMDGVTYTEWQYSEKRMEWTLPNQFTTMEEVQVYLDSIYDAGDIATGQIVQWAQASKVTLGGMNNG